MPSYVDLAIVGCVFEQTTSTTPPVVAVLADGDLTAIRNAVFVGNTVVGGRTNWLYNDAGNTATDKSGFHRFNIETNLNMKSDLFNNPTDGQNGGRIGNWAAVNGVGYRASAMLRGGTDNSSQWNAGDWVGETRPAGDVSGTPAAPLAVGFASDQSYWGGKAGNGDYTPSSYAGLPRVPSGFAPFPVDQKGRPVGNDGTALIGALQPA